MLKSTAFPDVNKALKRENDISWDRLESCNRAVYLIRSMLISKFVTRIHLLKSFLLFVSTGIEGTEEHRENLGNMLSSES